MCTTSIIPRSKTVWKLTAGQARDSECHCWVHFRLRSLAELRILCCIMGKFWCICRRIKGNTRASVLQWASERIREQKQNDYAVKHQHRSFTAAFIVTIIYLWIYWILPWHCLFQVQALRQTDRRIKTNKNCKDLKRFKLWHNKTLQSRYFDRKVF